MNSPAGQYESPPRPRRLGLTLLGAAVLPIPLICLLSANCSQPLSGTLGESKALPQNRAGVPTSNTAPSSNTQTANTQPADQPQKQSPSNDTDDIPPLQQRVLGVWEDDYQGHRTLTLNEDGTGSMLVELEGLASSLFAKQMEFDEEWSFDVDGSLLTMIATGGKPTTKVNLVLRMYGTKATYKVVDVSEDVMVLVDQADEKRYEWRRVHNDLAPEDKPSPRNPEGGHD